MGLLSAMLGLLGVVAGPGVDHARLHRSDAHAADRRMEQRELAKVLRRLPDRYSDRLRPRTVKRITHDAAAGRWEKAVDRLITALPVEGGPVTAAERDELRAILDTLGMPGERVNALTLTQQRLTPEPSTRPTAGGINTRTTSR